MPCSTLPQDDGGVRIRLDRPEIKANLLFDAHGKLVESEVKLKDFKKEKLQNIWTAAQRIGGGVVGLVKAELHIDRATEHVITARRNICNSCEHYTSCWDGSERNCCGKMNTVAQPKAKTCGCVIEKKITITSETCPLDPPKW